VYACVYMMNALLIIELGIILLS